MDVSFWTGKLDFQKLVGPTSQKALLGPMRKISQGALQKSMYIVNKKNIEDLIIKELSTSFEEGMPIEMLFTFGYGDSEFYQDYKTEKNELKEATNSMPNKKFLFYFPPYTLVVWDDYTWTMVKTHGDPFSKEFGYAMAIVRKFYDGNRSAFLRDVESGICAFQNPEDADAL